MSGADLANLVNEAALHAVRRGSLDIAMADFETARDRVLLGQRRESMVLSFNDGFRLTMMAVVQISLESQSEDLLVAFEKAAAAAPSGRPARTPRSGRSPSRTAPARRAETERKCEADL